MRRCGCGDTVIEPGCGIHMQGTGDPDDPYIVSVDPCALAGDGLRAQDPGDTGHACRVAVAVAPNGGISVGPDGLYLTGQGGGTGGSDPSKPSVQGVAQRGQTCKCIVGAYLGGYWFRPQSTRDAVKWAAERGYDLLHLPVRMLSDGTPAITPDPYLGRQNGNQPGQQVQAQTPSRWRSIPNDTGDPQDPAKGWFGYCAHPETGLLTLNEAMDLAGTKVPLVLELQWPAVVGPGGKPAWIQGQEPPPQRVDQFIAQIKRAVQSHNADQNVIVTSQWPTVPGPQPGSERDVFAELGLPHTGPALYTPQDADRLAPKGATVPQHQKQQGTRS